MSFWFVRSEFFEPPRQLDGLETAWLSFPFVIRPESGIVRSEVQEQLEARGIDTRMVWTGTVVRQPMMRSVAYRQDPAGYPNADRPVPRRSMTTGVMSSS